MNEKLFKIINQYSGRFSPLDFLMIFVSNKTRYVFVFMLIFMWFKNGPHRKAVYNAGLSAGIMLFLHTLIKLFYFKPRPFVKRRVGILIPSKRDSTFPSKHTLLVFAISTSIYLYNRVIGSVLWVLALLTGVSRIWVGHHYPYDIIGSAVIATLTSMIIDKTTRGNFVR
ncbi:undecaprenyl-diphosphatase [Robertmurraya beringensis]|uniref:Undecaprenyl-diphosphatase n=1 Tax=Robertmurraya beringensis TaxID=641660 RepID=A0ABV6KNI0_9BACI